MYDAMVRLGVIACVRGGCGEHGSLAQLEVGCWVLGVEMCQSVVHDGVWWLWEDWLWV